MLIIPFSSYFATLLDAFVRSFSLTRVQVENQIHLHKSDFRGSKKCEKSRVEIAIRNKMHSSCSVNDFGADFPPTLPLTLTRPVVPKTTRNN